jgi:hypothetical protein
MSFRSENRIPTKHVLTFRRVNAALALTDKKFWFGIATFMDCKNTLSISRFIFKVLDHVPEALSATVSKEVLTINIIRCLKITYI